MRMVIICMPVGLRIAGDHHDTDRRLYADKYADRTRSHAVPPHHGAAPNPCRDDAAMRMLIQAAVLAVPPYWPAGRLHRRPAALRGTRGQYS